ncbi:histidine kinase dimerization/phosphoacceptor domain -containing protein [Dyadobacter sp. NIV53]|uniref:tetratricopeptide repeat-containing sensor histidine kinase n=1 Tax=Dyadobacter sp. NIV53 TaxID=2861765 RepID=UPI001C8778F2|nr:histidine kinase dimerization/phosphoacceptor domain -containing protein [Dyadobacter sp. NIV53]
MQYNKIRINSLPAIIIILLVTPLFSFSQKMWADQSELLLQLRKSKADTNRVHILLKLGQYYMLREYYLYKTGNPRTQLDSASLFAEQALHFSQALKYENGKNEAILLKGDVLIRKHEIRSALNLLGTMHDSTRFRLLIILSRHYLFHTDRSKTDLDSSLFFLEQANKIQPAQLSAKWQPERIHVKAMYGFIAEGLQQSKKLYLEMIDEISAPGNEEMEALLWHELSTLIPLREKTGITRLYCLEKMHSLYKKSGNQEREAWALKTIADIHLVHGKLDLAESELLDALDLYKAIGYQDLHYIYDLLAVTYRNKGDFSKCIFYGLKAIESTEATNDSTSATTFYRRLAIMYRELGQPDKSVEWYSKMLNNRIFQDGDNVYKFRDAGFFARELIKIKREKEALAYILDINAKNKPIGIYAEASLVGSLAYCYRAMKQERQAEKYYLELIKLAGQLQKDSEITTEVYYEIGQYFIDKLQYGKALAYLQKALNASENTNSISLTKDIHLMLYRADSGLKNWPSATKHLLMHKLLSDSIFNETKNWQIQELQVQFETAKKQKDIELLNSQNQLQRIRVEEVNRTKNITLAAVVLLLIIIGLLLNRYLIKQRSNRKLEANQKELDQKNIFLETLNAEQDILLKEKEWLIKEVHHRVKNNLQMVTSLLYSQSLYLQDDAAVLAIKDSLRRMQTMSLIHQKLYQDDNISKISMPGYINDLMGYLHESFDTDNRITFEQTIEDLDLDVSQAIPLGLIITESIVNAIKYAFLNGERGVVDINLQRDGPDHLLLKISDNGIGLPAELDIMQQNSMGLVLMQGLTRQLKGSFTIESNQGVHIVVRFISLNK